MMKSLSLRQNVREQGVRNNKSLGSDHPHSHALNKYTVFFHVHLSDILTVLFRVRTDSDYDDYYVISKDEVNVQIENAGYFMNK